MNRSNEHSNPSPAPVLTLVRDGDSGAGAEAGQRAYRSPEGTYEPVLKSVLEDWTLTDAERSLLLYLATKPGGWKFYTAQLTRIIPRPERTIRRVLAALVRKGYLTKERIRDGGTFSEFFYLLRRERLLALPGDKSAGRLQYAGNEPLELTCENVSLPRSDHSAALPHSGDLADIVSTDVVSDYSQDQSKAQRAGDGFDVFGSVDSPKRVPAVPKIEPPAPKPSAAPEPSVPRETRIRDYLQARWPRDEHATLRRAVFYACTDAHGFPGEAPDIVADAVAEVAATYRGGIQRPPGWLQHERQNIRQAIDRLKPARERELRYQRERAAWLASPEGQSWQEGERCYQQAMREQREAQERLHRGPSPLDVFAQEDAVTGEVGSFGTLREAPDAGSPGAGTPAAAVAP